MFRYAHLQGSQIRFMGHTETAIILIIIYFTLIETIGKSANQQAFIDH